MKGKIFLPAIFFGILAMTTLSAEVLQAQDSFVPSDTGGAFTLTGTDGKPVSLVDFKNNIVLLMFGYTNCPDVCPTTLLTLKRVLKQLGKKAGKVRIIFITLDPERDTPTVLKKFLAYFGKSIIGLSGTTQEIDKVTARYKTLYRKVQSESASGYSVGHTDFIYIIDGNGHTRSMYSSRTPVVTLVNEIRQLLKSGGGAS